MAKDFDLGVDDIKELLEGVSEAFMNEEQLELEQECIAEEETGGRKTAGERKKNLQENSQRRVQQRSFQNSTSTFKGLKTQAPDPKTF